MKNWCLLILLAPLLYSCGRIKDPEFRRLDNFGVKKLGFESSTVGFTATYFNPNKFGVTVKEAAIDVFVDSIYLGKFSQTQEVVVNNNAEFSIPLEGTIGIQKALQSNLAGLLGKEVLVKADGSVKVGKVGVFVNKRIHYEGRQKVSADLIKNPAGAGL